MSTPGPTVPRWRLGRQLTQLREAAGVTQEEVARLLGCSLKTARRMEHGEVSVARGDLLVLLDRYQVHDQEKRNELLDLQKRGRQRAWWSSLGPFYENNTATLLEFQSAASAIRTYEVMGVPGWFQTADYARAVTAAMAPTMTTDEIDRAVELRLLAQEKLLKPNPPELFVVLDESVLLRPVGGREAHRGQLERLLEAGQDIAKEFRVVPLAVGAHPGIPGPFSIFDFDRNVRSPVVYVEGRAGNLYVENPDDVKTCRDVFDQLRAISLGPSDSLQLISDILSDR